MNKRQALTLYDYNVWANHRIMDAAAIATPEQFVAPMAGLSFGSLRGSLAHVLSAEIVWRTRCQEGVSLDALPGETDFPTLGALVERWQQEEAAMRAYLEGRTEEDFGAMVEYKRTSGAAYSTPLWQILSHVINHGTQFRAEAAVALTAYGCSPGDLDLIYYLREHAR